MEVWDPAPATASPSPVLAILRAQWLSMRSFRPGSRRRGIMFSIITGVVWYGFWSFLALGAYRFTSNPENRTEIEAGLPSGLMFVFLYWQLAPLVSASLGASLDLKKLLIYPIPHRTLFLVEVLLRLTTSAEMLLLLSGALFGLFRNQIFGGWLAAPRLISSFLIFIVFNLLLAAGLRNLLERLLARKRLREVLVLLLVMIAGAPRLVMTTGVSWEELMGIFGGTPNAALPWVAATHFSLSRSGITAAATLAVWTALAYLFGRWQFNKSLRYDAQAAQATAKNSRLQGRSWVERLYRVPSVFLPGTLAAIVEKELRSLTRTPRFRLVFMMGFSFGLIVWLPLILGRAAGSDSVIRENFLTVVSVYALTLLGQVSYWNAFGFDRSAAQIYFCLPVPVSKALAGKNLAAIFFIFMEMLAVTAACLLVQIRLPFSKIFEAFLVTSIIGLYVLAAGNLSSVHFPRAMDPQRVAQGGTASRFHALLFFVYPVALLPVSLAYVARYFFESQTIFYLLLAFAALLGCVVYWIAMASAVTGADRRRETLLEELSRSEGPVVTQ